MSRRAKIWVGTIGAALLLCAGAVFVVVSPDLEAARADRDRMDRDVISSRLREFFGRTGQRPTSLEDMAPPRCAQGACLLTEQELRILLSERYRLSQQRERLVICRGTDCREPGDQPSGN